MPVCFQLFPKGSDEPAKLNEVDNLMCAHFGIEPDPVKYHFGWFDYIGFLLALGKSWEWIKAEIEMDVLSQPYGTPTQRGAEHMLEIYHWLYANYTSYAWREIGRRD